MHILLGGPKIEIISISQFKGFLEFCVKIIILVKFYNFNHHAHCLRRPRMWDNCSILILGLPRTLCLMSKNIVLVKFYNFDYHAHCPRRPRNWDNFSISILGLPRTLCQIFKNVALAKLLHYALTFFRYLNW